MCMLHLAISGLCWSDTDSGRCPSTRAVHGFVVKRFFHAVNLNSTAVEKTRRHVGDVWIVCWVQPSGISWNMEHWVTSCTQPGMLMHVHCCAPTIAVCLNRVAVTTRSSSSRLRRARVFVGTRQSGGGAAALDAVIVHAVLNVVGRRAGACSLTRGTRRVAAEARRRAHVARRCLRAADHLHKERERDTVRAVSGSESCTEARTLPF